MNNSKTLFLVVVFVAIGMATYMWWPLVRPAPLNTGVTENKLMSIENYVTQNISELSPLKEQVGGKFFVTSIESADGKGVVSYEDGHNAYVADFTYTSSDLTGHSISSFVIRD